MWSVSHIDINVIIRYMIHVAPLAQESVQIASILNKPSSQTSPWCSFDNPSTDFPRSHFQSLSPFVQFLLV